MRLLTITAALLLGPHAHAEVLKLGDVVGVAVRESPELASAKVDVELARAQLVGAEGIYDTHVGASVTGEVTKFAVTNPLEAGKLRSVGGNLYVSRLLSTGATVSLGIGSSFARTTIATATTDVYAQGLDVTVTQPLRKGAGSSVTDAPVRSAAHTRDAAVLDREDRARTLVVAITVAYWQVALAKSQLEVQQASLKQAEKQLELTQGAIRADKVAKSELIPVEEAIALRKANVLAAEQAVIERSLALRQLAGLEITPADLVIDTEAPPKVAAVRADIPGAVKSAFEKSALLARIRAEKAIADVELDRVRGLDRSTLDLAVQGGPLARGTTFGDSVENITKNTGYSATASLRFDHAIGMRTETGAVLAARAARLNVAVAERSARAQIAVAATRAVQRAKVAIATVELADKAIDLAAQSIDAEQRRFELGKTTNFEVLRRQDELLVARLRRITAVIDYLVANAELEGLTGTILAKHGIVVR